MEYGAQGGVFAQVDAVESCVRAEIAGGLDALLGFNVDEVEGPVPLGCEGLGYSETDSTGLRKGRKSDRGLATRAFSLHIFYPHLRLRKIFE